MTEKTTWPDELRAAPCSAWVRIADQLPNAGDSVACVAEHKDGGLMEWAGRIIYAEHGHALMETRGAKTCRFILTCDTLWLRLPVLPNSVTSKPETPPVGISAP